MGLRPTLLPSLYQDEYALSIESQNIRLLRILLDARETMHDLIDNHACVLGGIRNACGMDYRAVTSVDGVERVKPVMSSCRIAKASSAESILRHCLKQLGFTRRWREGRLTNRQVLKLLEEVRLYGRAWLRHEAEEFVRYHLDSGRETTGQPERSSEALEGVSRATWVEGPGGYLIEQDAGVKHALGRFFSRAKNFVRELILSATMALSGPTPLTGEELAGADREAQKQEQYFDRFHEEIAVKPPRPRPEEPETPVDLTSQVIIVEPPPMTPGQFVARVESYADSAWQGAQRIDHEQTISQGVFKLERRVLGTPKTEHCEDCPPLAAMGWQPIGTLPRIGDSACGGRCLCHFRYSEGEGRPEFIQGKRGPLRAPSEVSVFEDEGGVEMIAEPPGGLAIEVPIAGAP